MNDTASTSNAFGAGADYVLSVPRVSVRTAVADLRGEAAPEPAGQVRLLRAHAAPFAGTTPGEVGIYGTTGCRVGAVGGVDGVVDVD